MTKRIYEAKDFLKKEKNMLAANRFEDRSAVSHFVDALYDKGAVKVVVPSIINYKSEDEMYADTLVIELPPESEKRHVLFELCNKEIISEGFEAEGDKGQKEIELWWD